MIRNSFPIHFRGILRIWIVAGIFIFSLLWLNQITKKDLESNPLSSSPEDEILIKTNQQKRDLDKTKIKGRAQDENNMDKEIPKPVNHQPSFKTITFYYPWYGNPNTDGQWIHWNHQILIKDGTYYEPPDQIGANYYPSLGPYSSSDPEVVDQHMKWMSEARIGIVSTSWWGKENSDGQLTKVSGFTDKLVKLLLDKADKYGLKIAIHLEPYEGRSAESVKADVIYVIDQYGKHPAFYRDDKNRPLFFFYDSYHTKEQQWASIFAPDAPNTLRNTPYDSAMIALYVNSNDRPLIVNGYFDGFYTYFGTDGFTEGSSTWAWSELNTFAKEKGKIFIPCVGPGYADMRIRPWNTQNQRGRRNGEYYDEMFNKAIKISPDYIGITSFNEWHEGTQIEPSVPKAVEGYKYLDFFPQDPDFYLKKTKTLVDKFDPIK